MNGTGQGNMKKSSEEEKDLFHQQEAEKEAEVHLFSATAEKEKKEEDPENIFGRKEKTAEK